MTKQRKHEWAKQLKVKLSAADKEKAKRRAARFGLNLDGDKAKARAAKFGLFNPELEKEKLKQRSERFKNNLPALTPEEVERRKRRAERFGSQAEDERRATEKPKSPQRTEQEC